MKITSSLNRLLALFVTGGFVFLLADTILEHWGILLQDPAAFIPILFSAAGSLIGVIAVAQWNGRWIRIFHLTLLTAFLVSAAGLYFHIENEAAERATPEGRAHEQKEKEIPLLAPLAFGGLGAFGILGTSRKWPGEVV